MKKLLTETQLVSYIKRLLKEEEEEVRISPEEYKDLLKKVAGQAQGILKLPKFRGKKLIVVGNLDLQNDKRITDLGPIKVEGNLDVSYTNIKSLDDVEVTGYPRYWQTPFERVVAARELRKKLNAQDELRKENAWDIDDTNIEGEMANAVFTYAMNEGLLSGLAEDDKERADELKIQISDLENQQENLSAEEEDYDEMYDQIQEQIDELQDEWDEIMSGKVDVYDLFYDGYHYEMKRFISLEEGFEFAVGTYQMADDSIEQYYGDMVDQPQHYFSNDFMENYIDGDQVAEYFEDGIRESIYDDPESYGVSKGLSRSQEEEIVKLENEIKGLELERLLIERGARTPLIELENSDMKNYKFKDYMDNFFLVHWSTDNVHGTGTWEIYQNGSHTNLIDYNDDEDEIHEDGNESRKDEIDDEISDLMSEIESIQEDPDGEPNEDEIENAVDNELYDIRRDPVSRLRDYGYDLQYFIDKGEMLDDLVRNADYGEALNGYDGTYDTIEINGTDYIVMKIN